MKIPTCWSARVVAVLPSRRRAFLLSVLLTQACAPAAPRTWSRLTAVHAGIPQRPDLVTVVPFEYAAPFELNHQILAGFVLIPGEIDGHSGTFLLDTGAGGIVLNSTYLQPTRTGGIDTVRAHSASPRTPCPRPLDGQQFGGTYPYRCHVTVQTLRVGTLRQTLAAPDPAPTMPNQRTNGVFIDSTDRRLHQFGRPVLGWIGPQVLDAFETIIDYPNQRVILIRLDAAGRRLADVPVFTSVKEAPMIPIRYEHDSGYVIWGVEATIGTMRDTLAIDSGAPTNGWGLSDQMIERIQQNPGFDDRGIALLARSMVVSGWTFDDLLFDKQIMTKPVVGFPFLRRLGVVGFNFRSHRLLTYQ